jgi:hypothetical protein
MVEGPPASSFEVIGPPLVLQLLDRSDRIVARQSSRCAGRTRIERRDRIAPRVPWRHVAVRRGRAGSGWTRGRTLRWRWRLIRLRTLASSTRGVTSRSEAKCVTSDSSCRATRHVERE